MEAPAGPPNDPSTRSGKFGHTQCLALRRPQTKKKICRLDIRRSWWPINWSVPSYNASRKNSMRTATSRMVHMLCWSRRQHAKTSYVNTETMSLNCGHKRAYCASPRGVWRAMEEWHWQGKLRNSRKPLSKCRFVNHKCHVLTLRFINFRLWFALCIDCR
jgi:hypothetical protein